MLRAAAFAAVATAIAALGHLFGGGAWPDLSVLIAGGAGAGAVVVGLVRKRRGPAGILAAMLACQLGFHLLFSINTHGSAMGSAAVSEPVRMLTFHLVAAVLSTLVLTTGERAIFGLFAALARSIRLPSPPICIDLPPRWTARFVVSHSPRPDGPLLSTSPRRGPPAARRRLPSRLVP